MLLALAIRTEHATDDVSVWSILVGLPCNKAAYPVQSYTFFVTWKMKIAKKNVELIGKNWAFWEEMVIFVRFLQDLKRKNMSFLDNLRTFAYTHLSQVK